MTLSKIAKLAHVSVSTVSKAFSMSREVNAETRELIFGIAKEHGCFKKYYNAKYPKLVIAVLCPEFQSYIYYERIAYIQKYLAEYNCEICVVSTNFSEEVEKNYIEYYNNYAKVDGIIIIDGKTETDSEVQIPVVNIDSIYKIDMKAPLEEAIEYFTEKGAEKIGFIGEKKTVGKFDVFKEIMKEKLGGINEDFISITDKRFEEGGYYAMNKLFERGTVPRAIVCAYDYMAIGAMKCISDKGLKVPEDVAVLGMDNISQAEYLNPPLSSIDLCVEKACKAAADMIIGDLTGKENKTESFHTAKLKLRGSTKID